MNYRYYLDVLLSQQMLPAINHVAGDTFVFQQDSAQAHRHHPAAAAGDTGLHRS